MNIKQPYRLPELKEKISSGEYGAELLLQHAMLIIDSHNSKEDGFRKSIKVHQKCLSESTKTIDAMSNTIVQVERLLSECRDHIPHTQATDDLKMESVSTPDAIPLLVKQWVSLNEKHISNLESSFDEYQAQHITDTARIATLESQLRVITDDRDGWVKQCSDRIDDALEFAKESDERASEINSMKEILHEHRNGAIEVVAKLLRVHENRSEPESREIAKILLAEKS